MINETDIEAFKDDLAVADKILERAKEGVPDGRHMHANEVMPFIRAYALMRDVAEKSAAFMTEQHRRELAGMSVADLEADKT